MLCVQTRRVLIWFSMIMLAACIGRAQSSGSGGEYSLVGVLKIGDELWVTLTSDNGQFLTSNGKNRRVTAIEYNRSEGYALIRDPNGQIIRAQLRDVDLIPGLDETIAELSAPTEEFSRMSQEEIQEYARKHPNSMMYQRSGTDQQAASDNKLENGSSSGGRSNLVVGGGFASGESPGNPAETQTKPGRPVISPRPLLVGSSTLGNNTTTSNKPSRKKSGGVITVQNDVVLPGEGEDYE